MCFLMNPGDVGEDPFPKEMLHLGAGWALLLLLTTCRNKTDAIPEGDFCWKSRN